MLQKFPWGKIIVTKFYVWKTNGQCNCKLQGREKQKTKLALERK
jgi:hypothetical protein